jgi:parvulin-like peptidyl-prolyl isomerase
MRKIYIGSIVSLLLMVSNVQAKVYATVNGVDITDQEIAMLLRNTPGANIQQMPPEIQKKIVEQAVERELLSEYAQKSSVVKSKEYKDALKKMKKDLALEAWMKQQFDSIKISDKEAKEFFNKNKEKFVKPKRAQARHILVKSEDEAKKIIAEMSGLSGKELEKKFIELAKSKSTGPTGPNGGELGWFADGQMVKPFSDAAFALNKGEITKKPVKTQFGYHIILLEDKDAGGTLKYDEVKSKIEQTLKMQKFQKIVKDRADSLKKKAKIVIK